jgi:hypothetical protein
MMDLLLISVVTIYVIVLVFGIRAAAETYMAWYRRPCKPRSPHRFTNGLKSAAPKHGRAA